MSKQPVEPGWYLDRSGKQTYWTGEEWTDEGPAGAPAPPAKPTKPVRERPDGDASRWEADLTGAPDPERVQDQVRKTGTDRPSRRGGGTLFSEPILVVNQKVKLIEMANEYAVFDQRGKPLGTVVQVGQTTLKKVARFFTSLDQFMTHRLEVRDNDGAVVLRLTRPAKIMLSRIIVEGADGEQIGEIVQESVFGRIKFAFVAGGEQIGAIQAQNWRAWDFSITDSTGEEIATISKTWEGFAKTMFTTADNYVVRIHHDLTEPLASLVVASALTVDTALKQDDRGLG